MTYKYCDIICLVLESEGIYWFNFEKEEYLPAEEPFCFHTLNRWQISPKLGLRTASSAQHSTIKA